MKFKDRLVQLRKELQLTQTEFAEKIGFSRTAISAWEIGRNEPSNEDTIKIADFFGVSVDYIIGNSDVRKNYVTAEKWNNTDEFGNPAVVLVYGTIPAGIPMEMIEDIIDTEEIDASMLKGGKEYFGLKIKGNSMYPEYLDGDTIILEKVDNVESGTDAVVRVNGDDATFKRVFKNENGIILQPLNPEFQPMIYTNEQIEKLPVRVIGKVVELRRKK